MGGPGASLPCESPPERVFDVPSAGSGRRRPRGNAAGNPARKAFDEMFHGNGIGKRVYSAAVNGAGLDVLDDDTNEIIATVDKTTEQ